MRLGVLWWEKLKIHERQGRIVSLDQLMGVGEQLLIFSSCLLAGRVKKLQMFINFCLKVDYSANLNHSKSTWRHYLSSCEMLKIVTWHQKLSAAKSREAAVILVTLCLTSWYYVIAWNSKWRRIWHKYVTNQRNVKNLAESASTCLVALYEIGNCALKNRLHSPLSNAITIIESVRNLRCLAVWRELCTYATFDRCELLKRTWRLSVARVHVFVPKTSQGFRYLSVLAWFHGHT